MKKLISFLFIAGILLAACSRETLPGSFRMGSEGEFQIGGEYLSENHSLQFKITEIKDSRCPSDVVCVWQGEAVIKINVLSPISGTLQLSTYDNQTDTLGNYSFQLVNVSPYPVSTEIIELEDYDVTLKIEELE